MDDRANVIAIASDGRNLSATIIVPAGFRTTQIRYGDYHDQWNLGFEIQLPRRDPQPENPGDAESEE